MHDQLVYHKCNRLSGTPVFEAGRNRTVTALQEPQSSPKGIRLPPERIVYRVLDRVGEGIVGNVRVPSGSNRLQLRESFYLALEPRQPTSPDFLAAPSSANSRNDCVFAIARCRKYLRSGTYEQVARPRRRLEQDEAFRFLRCAKGSHWNTSSHFCK
jgi:hypothetical protein